MSLAEDNFLLNMELKLNQPHAMLWAHIISTHMLDHSNLAVPVNAACYVELLDAQLIPQLRDKKTDRRCAPAHIALSVQEVHNKQCLGYCSPTSPVPLHRPPRVPDFTRGKSLLHCIIKVQPSVPCCRNSDELRRVVECACTAINSAYATRNLAAYQVVSGKQRCTYRST